MSYEVYVDVRHHPRHLDDWEERLSNCGKYAWETGQPWEPIVAGCLRELADRIDPPKAVDHTAALEDAAEYLRLASTWIVDTDRHVKTREAWHRAVVALEGKDGDDG